MKNIFKSLLVLAAAATLTTGCIKETFPQSDYTTTEQLANSSAGLAGAISGLSAQMYQRYYFFGSANQQEYDFSYAAVLLNQARATADFVGHGEEGYDWFLRQAGRANTAYTHETTFYRVNFMTLYKVIKSANDIISIISAKETLTDLEKQYLGIAYAVRATMYYDLFAMYTPVAPNEGVAPGYVIDADLAELTVPIILTSAEPQPASGSARAKKEDLIKLIKSDLDKAEANFLVSTPECGSLTPSLPVVYGLKARLALALEEWENAKNFAEQAIATSGKQPMNADQLHDPTSAFCAHKADDSWMWYYNIPAETMGNLCNTPGFIAGEADWGYNSLVQMSCHKWIYDRINYTDTRKTWFIDPDRSAHPATDYKWSTIKVEGQAYLDAYPFETLPDYMAFKFRCKDGNWADYKVGGSIDFPIMRVEEMYLIKAEAEGMLNGGDGSALQEFVRSYRDPAYDYETVAATFATNDFVQSFQQECFYQKRLEFFGEGVGYYDMKRIGVGIHTSYAGTNQTYPNQLFNYAGAIPFWNYMIPVDEIEANELIILNGDNPVEVGGIMQTKNNPSPANVLANN